MKFEKALINSSLKVLCEELTIALEMDRFHFELQNGPSFADRNGQSGGRRWSRAGHLGCRYENFQAEEVPAINKVATKIELCLVHSF